MVIDHFVCFHKVYVKKKESKKTKTKKHAWYFKTAIRPQNSHLEAQYQPMQQFLELVLNSKVGGGGGGGGGEGGGGSSKKLKSNTGLTSYIA